MLTRSVRLREPGRPAAEVPHDGIFPVAAFSARRPDFYGTMYAPTRNGEIQLAAAKQISRAAVGSRVPRDRTLRPWEASQESLRNYACKDASGKALPCQMQSCLLRCIFTGSLRRLLRCIGGGFRFPPPPMSGKERKLPGRRVTLM